MKEPLPITRNLRRGAFGIAAILCFAFLAANEPADLGLWLFGAVLAIEVYAGTMDWPLPPRRRGHGMGIGAKAVSEYDYCLGCNAKVIHPVPWPTCRCGGKVVHVAPCTVCKKPVGWVLDDDYCAPEFLVCSDHLPKKEA